MKNPIPILVVITVIVIFGIGAYTLSRNSFQFNSMMKKDETMMSKKETFVKPTDTMMQKDNNTTESGNIVDDKMATSRYVQYSKLALNSASSNRRILFFYASWCPICKPVDASFIQNVSKIPSDVTLIRVNYNDPETDQEEKDLAKKYGIIYQHTFVQIDDAGKEITKWNGGQIDELLSAIK